MLSALQIRSDLNAIVVPVMATVVAPKLPEARTASKGSDNGVVEQQILQVMQAGNQE